MTPGIITFGEFMLRLRAPGFERLLQSPMLEATFGGTEANVAIALTAFGMPATLVTVLPTDNPISDCAIGELRRQGVDTSHIVRGPGRFGVYYLETGANQRPSRILYDREHSAIALAKPGDIQWDNVFAGARWFHITGITPAISASAAALAMESVTKAQALGLTVSIDINHRKNLWKWGKSARIVMSEMVKFADVLIANEEHAQITLGIETDGADKERYQKLTERILDAYPNLKSVAITMRESKNASHNGLAVCLNDRKEFMLSRRYEITHIVDRIGGGDALTAGLIYGMLALPTHQEALEFAVASGCLKHSIPGDFSRSSLDEVMALVHGGGSGKVQR